MRKTKFTTLLLLFLFLLYCKREEPQLPVEEEKLVLVLSDIHLAEAALQNQYGYRKDSLAHLYYRQIYSIHELDSVQFEASMRVLRRHPGVAERVYSKVLEELSKREAEVKQ